MPFAQIKDTQLYYEIHGEGFPLVMLHGLGGSHHFFKYQIDFFQKNYQLIVPDIRGNGQSGKLKVPIKDILKTQCEDLKELLDQLHITAAVFLGVSYGGCLLQLFTHLYPEKVKGLILGDSFCNVRPHNAKELLMYMELHNIFEHALPRSLLRFITHKLFCHWPPALPQIDQLIARMRRIETAKQRLAMNQICFDEYLPTIHVPTLGIVGDYLPMEMDYMERVIKAIPHAHLVTIHYSLHITNWCQPAKFNDVVLTFLQKEGFY